MSKGAIKELSSNALEIVLDDNLDNGILKDIPFFGSAVKIAELTMSIRDHFFLKKLSRFIYQLSDLSEADKETIKNFSKSPDSEIISNKLIQVIDNVTDIEKSDLIGKLFISFCSGKINKSNFLRAIDTIHHYFLEDLKSFIYHSHCLDSTYEDLEYYKIESLISSPLIKEMYIDRNYLIRNGREDEIDTTKYEYSNFGSVFKEVFW